MLVVGFAGEPHVHRPRARDIATGRVRLSHHAEARVGRAVVVEFAAIGAVPGTVAWVEGEEIGVRFAETIDPEQARLTATGEYRRPTLEEARQALRRV